MTQTFTCPHGTTEVLNGSDNEYYCRECKSLIFTKEETTRQERELVIFKQKAKGLYTSIDW